MNNLAPNILLLICLTLGLITSGGNEGVKHYDIRGKELNFLSSTPITKTEFNWVAVLKLFFSGVSFTGSSLVIWYMIYMREYELSEPQEAPLSIDEQKQQILNNARLNLYENQAQIDALILEFANTNGLSFQDAKSVYLRIVETQKRENEKKVKDQQIAQLEATVKQLADRVQSPTEAPKTEDQIAQEIEAARLEHQQQEKPVNEFTPVNALKVLLGRDMDTQEPIYWEPSQSGNGFFMGLGCSGSGKTQLIYVFLEELRKKGYPTVFFSFHDDVQEFPGYTTLRVNGFESDLGMNPLALISTDVKHGGPKQRRDDFIQLCKDLDKDLGTQQLAVVSKALDHIYRESGLSYKDPQTWGKEPPTLSYLLNYLRIMENELAIATTDKDYVPNIDFVAKYDTVSTLLNRLDMYFDKAMFSTPETKVAQFFDGYHIIDLSGISNEVEQWLIATHVINLIINKAKTQPSISPTASDRERYRLFVGADECSILFAPNKAIGARKDDNENPMNVIALKMRKYGLGSFTFSQSIKHFSEAVIAQFKCKFSLLLELPDAKLVQSTVGGFEANKLASIPIMGSGFYKCLETLKRVMVTPSTHGGLPTDRGNYQ